MHDPPNKISTPSHVCSDKTDNQMQHETDFSKSPSAVQCRLGHLSTLDSATARMA